MALAPQSSQSASRSILSRHEGLKAEAYTGVFFVGLGDQFDDDRRLVRASEVLPEDMRDTKPVHAPRAAAAER